MIILEVLKKIEEITIPLLQDKFKKMQSAFGLLSEGESSASEDSPLPDKLISAIDETVTAKVASLDPAPVEPVQVLSKAERFKKECDEARNRALAKKNLGEIKVSVGNNNADDFVKSNPDDNTKNFSHQNVKRTLGIDYDIVTSKTGPGQPAIWLRCKKNGNKSSRDVADGVLSDRTPYANKLGAEWAVDNEDNIFARLAYLKRKQLLSAYKFGKSARFFVNLNDGTEETYNALQNATNADIRVKRANYIKTCTVVRIDAPKLFEQLPDDVIGDTAAMKKVASNTAFYIDKKIHEYTEAELANRRTFAGRDIEVAAGTRSLRWNVV